MGAWGDGIFENDTALDYCHKKILQIKSELEMDISSYHDGILERRFGPCIAIITTLVTRHASFASLVDRSEVERWKASITPWLEDVISTQTIGKEGWVQYSKNIHLEIQNLLDALD